MFTSLETVSPAMDKSRTGSTRGTYKLHGEIIALPFRSKKASWKTVEASANNVATQSTMMASYKDPNLKAQLTPYHPLAPRNRMPVKFKNEPTPGKRFTKDRNAGTYDPFDQHLEPGFTRFRTTTQNYFDYDVSALNVGGTNQGIVSAKSKIIHTNQMR